MEIINRRKDPKTVFTSKYVGVMWHSTKKQWRAAISVCGIKTILGYFDSERLAVEAYNEVAIRYGKPYNFIEGD
jgi:hypothetical protein